MALFSPVDRERLTTDCRRVPRGLARAGIKTKTAAGTERDALRSHVPVPIHTCVHTSRENALDEQFSQGNAFDGGMRWARRDTMCEFAGTKTTTHQLRACVGPSATRSRRASWLEVDCGAINSLGDLQPSL